MKNKPEQFRGQKRASSSLHLAVMYDVVVIAMATNWYEIQLGQ